MKVTALNISGFDTVKLAGKVCYAKDIENVHVEKVSDDYVGKLVSMGHMSPFEHLTLSFLISGVSRSLTHQLVRHRIASYSQRSQRYVSEAGLRYVTPYTVKDFPATHKYFEDSIKRAEEDYGVLMASLFTNLCIAETRKNETSHSEISVFEMDEAYLLGVIKEALDDRNLEDLGPLIKDLERKLLNKGYEKEDLKALKKKAMENARAVLPNATASDIVVTMNARAFVHFLNERMCTRSQDEIRTMASLMLKSVSKADTRTWEALMAAGAGPKCVSLGYCPEEKSCGIRPLKEKVVKR